MIRVMVVDDSPLVRKIATDILEADEEISVVATASNGEIALQKIEKVRPDVITMDLKMPGMGGLATIEEVMRRVPTPIIVMSVLARRGAELTLQALESGAIDFIAKPKTTPSGGIAEIAEELVNKTKHASRVRLREIQKFSLKERGRPEEEWYERWRGQLGSRRYDVIAIGTSTGGPLALERVLKRIPEDFPIGIVVVIHMPGTFTKSYAERLDSECRIKVREAVDGDEIRGGVALIAPGGYHMEVKNKGGRSTVVLHKGEPILGHRPSVDILMRSVAREYGNRAIGVIMTGMGRDGAEGISELKKKGGYVIAQDGETSVIFGMNREVIMNGDADETVGVNEIAERMMERLRDKKHAERS